MLNASDVVLGSQKREGNKSGGTKSLERDGSYDGVSPSSHKLLELSPSTDCNASIQSAISLVEDILENILSLATNRSALRKAGEHHHLSGSTRNHVRPASTTVERPDFDSGGAETPKPRDLSKSPFTCSSTSETDSSYSDSENDTALHASTVDKPGQVAVPNILRTRNEQDTSEIYIPRPDFATTDEHTLLKVGTISAVLDHAVVVTTFDLAKTPRQLSNADISNATALDTGSLLCLSDGTFLGAVFETFGPVSSPLYVVRFNSSDEIPALARVGIEVKYVEQETRLVRGRDIRGKGYDASGKDDEEVEAEEFSDDETERRSKKTKRFGAEGHCDRPHKWAKANYERNGHGRRERLERKQESHSGEHECLQHQKLRRRRAKRPAKQAGGPVSMGYNPYPPPYHHTGMFSLNLPQALVPQPSFPSAFNNNVRNPRNLSTLYTPGVPIDAPSPLIVPPMHPGPAASPMQPTGSYRLSPFEFPQTVSHYRDSSSVSHQSHFVCPEQGWSAPSSRVMRDGSRPTCIYRQHKTSQGQDGLAPNMQNSGLHQLQGPHFWKGG